MEPELRRFFKMRLSGVVLCGIVIYLIVAMGGCAAIEQGVQCDLCDSGMQCQACMVEGVPVRRCTRIEPLNPFSKVKGMPFNRYSWLTSHISVAMVLDKSGREVLVTSQEDPISIQLRNGVRAFVLELYEFKCSIWLCHPSCGKCHRHYLPVLSLLGEIRVFLEANPLEIVTIMIEDYVATPYRIITVLSATELGPFLFPASMMPKDGREWPTVDEMIAMNHRLLVFSSNHSKESEGIAYKWNYLVENQYGDFGMINGSCFARAGSSPLNTRTRSLVLMNYFPSAPDVYKACSHNSQPLKSMMYTCFEAAGQRWPNFIVVDFYKRSDGGGAAEAVDEANARLLCGCASLACCNMTLTSELSQPGNSIVLKTPPENQPDSSIPPAPVTSGGNYTGSTALANYCSVPGNYTPPAAEKILKTVYLELSAKMIDVAAAVALPLGYYFIGKFLGLFRILIIGKFLGLFRILSRSLIRICTSFANQPQVRELLPV